VSRTLYNLVLFTSESGNLAKFVGNHFKSNNPIYISPDDDLEVVFHHLVHLSIRRRLIGISVGYTKLIPKNIIDLFEGQLFNTHPGELPLTRGLYGITAIQKMITSYKSLGRITIHRVDEHYDTGSVIATITFPYLTELVDMQLLYELSNNNDSPIPKDYLYEWTVDYSRMLKLIEPTFVVKFIDNCFKTKLKSHIKK